MGKLKTDEKGFGAVEAILIVIIIVLIGAVGYLVYKNNHKTVVTKVVTVTKAIDSSTSSPPQGNYVNVIQDEDVYKRQHLYSCYLVC